MNLLNIPDDFIKSAEDCKVTYDFGLEILTRDDKVRFSVDGVETSWMIMNDGFVERIQFENLNPDFLAMHLAKEIEIKNVLDRGIYFLECEEYPKAVDEFDDVLYYDPQYAEALFFKSKAIFGEGHFVKSLRNYKKAVKLDSRLKDVVYHRLLLKKSSEERDNFPKIKRSIYAGDEYFAKGDYAKAWDCYDRALSNPTSFKTKILSKLLNKKATALLRLKKIGSAVDVFKESVNVKPNDYAYFYLGIHCYGEYSQSFKKHLNITKRQLLKKAQKLNDVGEHDLAMECLDEFFDNHFKVDDDYMMALDLKSEISMG